MPISTSKLVAYLDQFLESEKFQDYAPNGLQIEGRPEINTLVTGVSACLELIRYAVEVNADAILVHHGYFWRGEDQRLTGIKGERVAQLMAQRINLVAYHLPLDAHPEVGNNAALGEVLDVAIEGLFGADAPMFGVYGSLRRPLPGTEFAERLALALERPPTHIEVVQRPLRKIAWCSGAASSMVVDAARLGADAFVTGELSERSVHEAREIGIDLFGAGHHATERFGVQRLGDHLAEQFGCHHIHYDIHNPI